MENYTGWSTNMTFFLGGLLVFCIGLVAKLVLERLSKAAMVKFETWLEGLDKAVDAVNKLTGEVQTITQTCEKLSRDMTALRTDLENGFKSEFEVMTAKINAITSEVNAQKANAIALAMRVTQLESLKMPRSTDGTIGDRKLPVASDPTSNTP
jgi:outer membrane murein-binding lipoprotein Lpp